LDAKLYKTLYINHKAINELIYNISNIWVYRTITTPGLSSAVVEIY
jgi:hypothetical protein